ncbi:oxidoreductase [Xanthomonas cannabis]|uniref:oxidoreductase n=1 Tax=Xanthomonas cannabis TaxID=1885674 RepID=UPI000A7EDA9B
MNNDTRLGGTFTLPGTGISIKRMGYGTIQLPGAHVWGPPRDKAAALAVLKEAVALGVDHIDTAEFYGPHVSNQLIREALHPYADELRIVTKIGIGRGSDASWNADRSPASLRRQVQDNLVSLGLETLDVVNLRLGALMDTDTSAIAEPVACLAELQREGLVRHIGLSNITPAQYHEAEKLAKIVCVQNNYNLVKRDDDAFIDALNDQGVAYVPFFPLGGSRRCNRTRCRRSPRTQAPHRSRSPSPGCCSARPIFSSSQALRRCPTCAKTLPPPGCTCPHNSLRCSTALRTKRVSPATRIAMPSWWPRPDSNGRPSP